MDLHATGFGNPFRVGEDREGAISRYRQWIAGQPQLLARLPELHGKTLGCWCAPAGGLPGNLSGQTCHGEVLAALADLSSEELATTLARIRTGDRLGDTPPPAPPNLPTGLPTASTAASDPFRDAPPAERHICMRRLWAHRRDGRGWACYVCDRVACVGPRLVAPGARSQGQERRR